MVLDTITFVNEFRDFVETELLGSLSKHEKHGVDDVGFARPVRTHHCRKALVERTDLLDSSIRLEVFQDLREGGEVRWVFKEPHQFNNNGHIPFW